METNRAERGLVRRVPGFVDAHSHDDLAILRDPGRPVKRRQGVTHQVIGNCGLTPFPLVAGASPEYEAFLASVLGGAGSAPPLYAEAADFVQAAPRNVTVLLGYNTLRERLFGPLPRPLDAGERRLAAEGIRRALDAGARGVSVGLAYRPALHADREELVSMASATPLLTVHMRNESSGILDSVDEIAGAVEEANRRGARCHLHISHLKIAGKAYWPLFEELHGKVRAWHEAIGVTFDHYPFAFGSTGLAALLPPEFSTLSHEVLGRVSPGDIEARLGDADWENYVSFAGVEGLVLTGLVHHAELNGRTLEGFPLGELIRDLVVSEPSPAVLIHGQSERVIDEFLRLPFGCIGSDALPDVTAHPRLTSTFPEFLRRMRAMGMTLEFAVEKASLLPRRIFGIESAESIAVDEATFALVDHSS